MSCELTWYISEIARTAEVDGLVMPLEASRADTNRAKFVDIY